MIAAMDRKQQKRAPMTDLKSCLSKDGYVNYKAIFTVEELDLFAEIGMLDQYAFLEPRALRDHLSRVKTEQRKDKNNLDTYFCEKE